MIGDRGKETKSGADRRRHTRFPVEQEAKLTILRGGSSENLTVTLVNLSKSGIAITLSAPLLPGAVVEIQWEQTAVFAEVRYCGASGPGVYRAGVQIQQVVSTRDVSAHLSWDTLDLYACARLPEVESRFVARHLLGCEYCQQRLAASAELFAKIKATSRVAEAVPGKLTFAAAHRTR